MRNVNATAISSPDTGNQTGNAIDTGQLFQISFQAYFGDNEAAGTFKIQASNDVFNPLVNNNTTGVFVPINWTNIPNASVSITGGATSIIPGLNMSYRWIRAVYTYSSGGSSTINVTMDSIGF